MDGRELVMTSARIIDPATTHSTRADLCAVQLRNALKAKADAGLANPADTQLLAALDRWSAGELV